MIIQQREYEKCPTCQSTKSITEEVYGCDECGAVIDLNKRGVDWLNLSVCHKNNNSAEDLNFCSWKCLFNRLPNIKTDYFISLPQLQFSPDVSKKCSGNTFFKELNLRKKKR